MKGKGGAALQAEQERLDRFFRGLVEQFAIRDEFVRIALRKELGRARPKCWNDFKAVWRLIYSMDRAPKIDWAKLRRFSAPFLPGK